MSCVRIGSGGQFPPAFDGIKIGFVCSLNPPPHSAVHGRISTHSPITQVSGQESVLQDTDRVERDGHVPPLLAGVNICKVCVLVPPPHDTLHRDESIHDPNTQSIGFCFDVSFSFT